MLTTRAYHGQTNTMIHSAGIPKLRLGPAHHQITSGLTLVPAIWLSHQKFSALATSLSCFWQAVVKLVGWQSKRHWEGFDLPAMARHVKRDWFRSISASKTDPAGWCTWHVDSGSSNYWVNGANAVVAHHWVRQATPAFGRLLLWWGMWVVQMRAGYITTEAGIVNSKRRSWPVTAFKSPELPVYLFDLHGTARYHANLEAKSTFQEG